jgi:integrase
MSPRRAKAKAETGIRRKGGKWQAYVRVGGELRTKVFDLDTPPADMRAWRAAQKKSLPSRRHCLADDVARYLETVQHMPTLATREQHLDEWVEVLGGDRRRAAIQPHEVAAALSRWLTEPRPPRKGPGQRAGAARTDPLGPAAVRHRYTALRSLYAALDGKTEAARFFEGVPKPKAPEPSARFIPPAATQAILDALRADSATRARLAVIATTGLPHKLLASLTPDDVDLKQRTIRWPARRKGRGAPGGLKRLSRAAVEAFKAFDRADAWGKFSASSMLKAWRRALSAAGLPRDWRPYDLRHSIGAHVYVASGGDLATVARALGHTDTRMAARYAAAANAMIDAKVTDLVGAKVRLKLPAKLPADRKPAKKRA